MWRRAHDRLSCNCCLKVQSRLHAADLHAEQLDWSGGLSHKLTANSGLQSMHGLATVVICLADAVSLGDIVLGMQTTQGGVYMEPCTALRMCPCLEQMQQKQCAAFPTEQVDLGV